MENLKLKKNERGISLIALVITIIVIIILAAIAFNSSTSTISKANYSKFVSNIGEVQDAIQTKAVTVKGFAMAGGTQVTDGQAYNYVAKGGSSESDFLPEAQVPDYTIIEETADIGIDLPEIKVNTPTETGVKVKYAVTKEGKVFIWPPYSYENEYNVRDKETVDKSLVGVEGELDIKVADKDLKIKTDEKGMLLNTSANGGNAGLTEEDKELLAKLKVGDYVNYVPTSKTVTTDTSKTGYDTAQTLTTQANTEWRILSIDETTGEILLTTQGATNTDTNVTLKGATGYLHGAEELNRICKELYSNTEKRITARSMTVEDLNKAVGGYDPTSDSDYGKEYTYTSGTLFYTYEENGKTVTSEIPKVASNSNPVTVKSTWYMYSPSSKNSTVDNILGSSSWGWLASPFVALNSDNAGACYGFRVARSGYVFASTTIQSNVVVYTPSYGLRPVVSLRSTLIEIGEDGKDGTTVATAWNLK